METDHKYNYLLKYIVITPTKRTVYSVGVIISVRWYKTHEMDNFK
jgi:hypothetical protein